MSFSWCLMLGASWYLPSFTQRKQPWCVHDHTKVKYVPHLSVPGSKLPILGLVIPPLIGNPYNGHINPYYWVDDHPLLKGNNGEFRPWHMYWFITISSPTHRNSFEAWSEQTHWFGKVCWINRFPSISFKPVSGQTDIFNKVNKATTFPPWSSPWLSQKHQRYTLTGSHSKTLQIQLYTCRLMVVIWMFPKIGVPPKWMVYNGKPLLKWMIWGYHYFWKHPYSTLQKTNIAPEKKIVILPTTLFSGANS